jgi:BCD family chlorophyll transporter-like MFS transporter
MGLWGASQAIAFGFGGLLGTAASDFAHWFISSSGAAYASVFAAEALLFIVSALLALRIPMTEQHKQEEEQTMAQPSFS